MSMKNGENKHMKRVAVLWVIAFSPLLIISIIYSIIIWKGNQNKRIFVEDIVERIEEVK